MNDTILVPKFLTELKTKEDVDKLWDSMKPLMEELKPKSGEAAELETLLEKTRTEFQIGTHVVIKNTGYTGKVVKYNENLGGFYPGVRYPVIVRIIHSDSFEMKKQGVIGSHFEYSTDQLELINESICIWPDLTRCREENLEEYTWKSDDFRVAEIPLLEDEDIEERVCSGLL